MKRFLLGLVISAIVGPSAFAAENRSASTSNDALAGRARPVRIRPAAQIVRRVAAPIQRVRPVRIVAPVARARLVPNGLVIRPVAPVLRPRLAANLGRRVGPDLVWHIRRPNGVIIARNYPSWSRNWWSPRYGVWFRYDPTTTGYYYYEPSVGYYVQTETITTYRQPLDTPISSPTTEPSDIPVTDPPDPVEP
jgi:hypothetical protein